MANYKESIVNGKSWIRCGGIFIENPHSSLGFPVRAIFREESVVDLGNGTYNISPYYRDTNPQYNIPRKTLSVIVQPQLTFDLYDPVTGEKTGATMTHAELYTILYSAYRTEAEKSDAAENA